jgi:hypothetical protein
MLVRLCYGDFDGSYADWGGLMGSVSMYRSRKLEVEMSRLRE